MTSALIFIEVSLKFSADVSPAKSRGIARRNILCHTSRSHNSIHVHTQAPVHTLIMSNVAWKTHCHVISYVIKQHYMFCEQGVVEGCEYWQEGKFRSISLGKQVKQMCVLIKAYILALFRTTQTRTFSFKHLTFIYIMIYEGLGLEVNEVNGRQCAEQGQYLFSCPGPQGPWLKEIFSICQCKWRTI